MALNLSRGEAITTDGFLTLDSSLTLAYVPLSAFPIKGTSDKSTLKEVGGSRFTWTRAARLVPSLMDLGASFDAKEIAAEVMEFHTPGVIGLRSSSVSVTASGTSERSGIGDLGGGGGFTGF